MSYAAPTDMLARYDARRVGVLVRDDGTMASAGALQSDTNLQAALDDGASLINAACLRGGRYQPADLTGLTGVDKALLLRLNCDLAYGLLVARRGYTATEQQSAAPSYAGALALLEHLADGVLIFNVQSVIAAGQPTNAAIDQNLQLVSSTTRLFGDLTINPSNPGYPQFGYPEDT